MKMSFDKNEFFKRFVPCVSGAGLLKNLSVVAGRTRADRVARISTVRFSFDDDFTSAVVNRKILTRRGIFRGKVSQRETQNNNNASKKGRRRRQIYE
jgi:hypothetical protein